MTTPSEKRLSSRAVGENPCSALSRTILRSTDGTRFSKMGSTLPWRRPEKGWRGWQRDSTKQRQGHRRRRRRKRLGSSWSGSCTRGAVCGRRALKGCYLHRLRSKAPGSVSTMSASELIFTTHQRSRSCVYMSRRLNVRNLTAGGGMQGDRNKL